MSAKDRGTLPGRAQSRLAVAYRLISPPVLPGRLLRRLLLGHRHPDRVGALAGRGVLDHHARLPVAVGDLPLLGDVVRRERLAAVGGRVALRQRTERLIT